MAQSQKGTNAARKRKKVLYEGTDAIREGMPVAYNYDTTSNILGVDTGVTPQVRSETTTAGGQNEGKYQRVELVTTANKSFFAGVVAGGSYAGLTGPRWIDIYIANGSIVPIRTDKSITQLDKLYLEAGENTVVNDDTAMPCVGIAVETVDRSSTNGIVLAKVDQINACDEIDAVTASSRTAVQLPTADIWDNFNLKELRENPMAGTLWETDFRRGNSDFPVNAFLDTDSLLKITTEAAGALECFVTTDNEAVEVMNFGPITSSGGKPWAFEARLKTSTITTAEITFFLGLMVPSVLVGDLIADGGAAPQASGTIGFIHFDDDTTELNAVFEATGQALQEHDTDGLTLVAATYVTVGMYYDGATVAIYYNGVEHDDPISAADIAAVTYPSATVMYPTITVKGGAAGDETCIVDWVRFAQNG